MGKEYVDHGEWDSCIASINANSWYPYFLLIVKYT